MGNTETKLNFRKAVIQLTTKTQPVDAADEVFWEQFWSESVQSVQDVFALIPASEIRSLREEMPSNLATLCYKAVEKLVHAADSSCNQQKEQQAVLNCIRLLTRILPYIFEDSDWRYFFWSSLSGGGGGNSQENCDEGAADQGESQPLAQSLVNALCDLLFCPDFTVSPNKSAGPDRADDLQCVDSCEYIWESGVGFASSHPHVLQHDQNRTEILKLLLTCFSETMYIPTISDNQSQTNRWIQYFTSAENRHALPLFTSLLNVVCAYDPVGYGLPYNHLLFTDSREQLVDISLQMLIVSLDLECVAETGKIDDLQDIDGGMPDNLFVNYLSRIHREEDFNFVLKGFTRLLNNPLIQTYLPNSTKKIQFHQELLVFFWKLCDYNKKFLFYVLKSSDVLDVLVPILFHLNDSRADQSRVGLMHIGVFILLLLSGERNFGVRLNKPYTASIPMDIPVFTGTHADLLIIVFHKIITTGHQRLQPLFDCLLTIIVNVSPYLKTLSMVASSKLLHFLEAFSTPWFLFSSPTNHHLVFFLLEIFNNIIQYQFDGNSNLVYTIIRKRNVFHQLANLPTDHSTIQRLQKRNKQKQCSTPTEPGKESPSMEGSKPALPAIPGTLKATLAELPGIDKMTEREQAHPSAQILVDAMKVANADALKNSNSIVFATDSSSDHDSSTAPIASAISIDTQATCAVHGTTPVKEPGFEIVQPLSTMTTQSETSVRSSRNSTSSQEMVRSPTAEVTFNPTITTWSPTPGWIQAWKQKLPLQTIMRLLQVLVPQVEKICIDKGLTDESEILKFLQHGTLVGLLPVPHPILIRKYQANSGTTAWFRTYMWGIIYLRNMDPPIWYDTDVKLFEIQRIS